MKWINDGGMKVLKGGIEKVQKAFDKNYEFY